MRTNRLIFLIGIIFLILISCSSFKYQSLKKEKGINAAIQNAIINFSNTSKLYKKGTVFSVSISELKTNKDLFVIRIGVNTTKMLMKEEVKIGSKGKLASRYLKKDNGKLFFWWDDDYPLNQETINVFNEYNLLLKDDLEGNFSFYDVEIDDSKKAVHYYFCKSDLLYSNYKKVTTNKGIGYYKIPNIKCN